MVPDLVGSELFVVEVLVVRPTEDSVNVFLEKARTFANFFDLQLRFCWRALRSRLLFTVGFIVVGGWRFGTTLYVSASVST